MLANRVRIGSSKKQISLPGKWMFNDGLQTPGDNVFNINFTHEGIAYNTIETEDYFGNLYVYFRSSNSTVITVYQFGEWVARYSNFINITDKEASAEFIDWLTANAKKV